METACGLLLDWADFESLDAEEIVEEESSLFSHKISLLLVSFLQQG
jgi:hypothetical protein